MFQWRYAMSRFSSYALCLGLGLLLAAGAARADFELTRELALAPGGEFELDAASGKITVQGGDRDGVRVRITSSRGDIEERFEFSFRESDGRALVKAEKRGSFVRRWFDGGSSLHFEVEVPRDASLILDTAGGAIRVDDIIGSVDADTSGGAISVERVFGDVRLDTSGGSITARRIDGSVLADTSGGAITIEGASGDVSADTSGGSVKVSDVGGRVEASSSGGPVTVSFAAGNAAGGSLSTSGGSVTAYVDPAVGLDVDLATSGGRASVDVPVTVRGDVSRSALRGEINGGGALLKLRSSGGSVRVKPL